MFMFMGCILLTLLSIVPIWNSICLISDSNYTYFAGREMPQCIIVLCIVFILLYALTIMLFFRRTHASIHTEQTIMLIANIFIMLFGLMLMMISIPLTHQAEITYTNLMYRCEYAEQTHRLFEYSTVLQNIRAQPECAKKYSIEECDGYEVAAPYTYMLKGMEMRFRCAGFCYKAPPAMTMSGPIPAPAPAPAKAPASAFLTLSRRKLHNKMTHLSLMTESREFAAHNATFNDVYQPPVYPPTLFSDYNFKASCEGMAARDMKHFAGDIGEQTFFQGLALVFIAVITGFLKLAGFCFKR
jgi:hypothetical protein